MVACFLRCMAGHPERGVILYCSSLYLEGFFFSWLSQDFLRSTVSAHAIEFSQIAADFQQSLNARSDCLHLQDWSGRARKWHRLPEMALVSRGAVCREVGLRMQERAQA